MIRSKRKTSKFMSAISVLLAVIMLSTTVFASGILTDFMTDDYTIEIYNGENKLSLKNEPFIYDGEYYLPLRDILNGFGITDATYNSGEITVQIPDEKVKYDTNIFRLTIGSAYIRHGTSTPNGYGVVMRCAPVLYNDTTFVTIDYFEDLMKNIDLQGFRLNVIRPTEPENYYKKGEKVFIGTAEEQDNYTGELAKRIIVDANGETIAVIPVEHQIPENIEQKFAQAEKSVICESFYQALYEQVFSCYNSDDDSVYESNLWFINSDGKYIAYFAIADIINIPKTEFNKNLYMTVTNTNINKNNNFSVGYTVYDENGNKVDYATDGVGFVGEYSIQIPRWWNYGKYKSFWNEDGTTRYFVQKSSYDKYGAGILFSIKKVDLSFADELLNMLAGSKLLYKNNEFAYLFIVPTDVQKPIWDGADDEDTEIVKEYDKMYADVEHIADSFEYWGND